MAMRYDGPIMFREVRTLCMRETVTSSIRRNESVC